MLSPVNPGPLVPAYEGVVPFISVPTAFVLVAVLVGISAAYLFKGLVKLSPKQGRTRSGPYLVVLAYVAIIGAVLATFLMAMANIAFDRYEAAAAYPNKVTS